MALCTVLGSFSRAISVIIWCYIFVQVPNLESTPPQDANGTQDSNGTHETQTR